MTHHGFNGSGVPGPEEQAAAYGPDRPDGPRQGGGRGPGGGHGGHGGGPWGGHGHGGERGSGWGPGRQPPPWVAGLLGFDRGERRRGPRVRRGDVRSAILDILRGAQEGEPVNGYQVIQQIAERTQDAWRPSPGSVYPTIQQLQDEGLVVEDSSRGRRALRLTEAGVAHVGEHAEELAAVWAPFTGGAGEEVADGLDLKPEIGQLMSAVWQVVTTGSQAQRRAAAELLVETRRRLYGILAEDDAEADEE